MLFICMAFELIYTQSFVEVDAVARKVGSDYYSVHSALIICTPITLLNMAFPYLASSRQSL